MNVSSPYCAGLPFHIRFNFLICTVLARVKPSAIVHLRSHSDRDDWLRTKDELMQEAGLSYKEIWEKDSQLTVFIYAEDFLREVLCSRENLTILKKYGYPSGFSFSEALDILVSRYDKDHFPHEIGVFLGYPPKDVLGYIENNGKNFVLCKYWKVYGNPDASIDMFKRIDFVRQQAVHKVLSAL